MTTDAIPTATHEGTVELLGITLRTYRLDDGRTIFNADDFKKLLEHMALADHAQK
jgi:hypothetical protein